jgi:hypothetical protein
MSDSQPPRGFIPSPWYALILLPIALVAGWWVGGLPVPGAKRAVSAAPVEQRRPRAGAGRAAASVELHRAVDPPSSRGSSQAETIVSQWTTLDEAVSQARENGNRS